LPRSFLMRPATMLGSMPIVSASIFTASSDRAKRDRHWSHDASGISASSANTPSAVATTDGENHEIDVLILATGFKVMDVDNVPTFAVTGSGGRSLSRFWDEHRLQAYEGVSVPNFPNLFSVMGPYGFVGSSYFALIEAQTHHIVRCLTRATRVGAARVEVREEANARFFAEMMRKRHRQIFWQDSCRLANSYYFDKNGDVPLRPTSTMEAYWRSRRFDLDDYRFSA